jgi:nitroreductase
LDINFSIKNTIELRRSYRNYKMTELDPNILAEIQTFAKSIDLPFSHSTDIRFFNAEPTNKLYMTMKSPPNNVAFLSQTDIVSISKTGFVGELIILFAQSKGIATCWYGHYKLLELQRLMPHLQSLKQLEESNAGYGYSKGITEGIRAIAVSPLGYYNESGLRLIDRVTAKTISFKRKDLKDLLEKADDFDKLSEDFLYALDLGRKSPSAANSQMWRFGFMDEYQTIIISMPKGYKHIKWEHPNVDIGICACHVWLGLVDKGYNPSVSIEEYDDRAIWKIKANIK